MAFGYAGAAAGGHNALQELLTRAFAEQQARQRMAIAQQEEDRRARESLAEQDFRTKQLEALTAERGQARLDRADNAAMQFMNADAGRMAQAENARLTRESQAENARLNREAANERANESNETRRVIAGLARVGQNQNADLDRQIKEVRLQGEQAKLDEAQRVKDTAQKAMQDYGDEMLSVIADLIDEQGNLKPGAAGIIGTFEGAVPEGAFFDADRQKALAALNRLNSNLSIETLQKLKEQSRTGATGFGSLTEKELRLVENARSTLASRRQGETDYAAELARIRKAIMDRRAGAAPVDTNAAQGEYDFVPGKGLVRRGQ